MTLNSIFQYFVPKDKKFFPLFEEAAKNLIVLAETLHEGVNAPKTERENFFNKVEELEAKIVVGTDTRPLFVPENGG